MNVIYSMTNRTYSWVRGGLTLLLGICLLAWPDFTAGLIVKLIAAFLLAAGIITLLIAVNLGRRDKSGLSAFSLVNIGVYLVFGLLMFLFPGFFLDLIVFLFGAVLLFFGIGQLANLYYSRRYASFSGSYYVIPALLSFVGIVLFFNPFASRVVTTVVFGACLSVYGLSECWSAWKLRSVVFDKEGNYIGKAEDVPYEEVDPEQDRK